MFTLLEVIEPNEEILDLVKDRKAKITKGKINGVKNTNIKTVLPVIYKIPYQDQTLAIYEYKGDFKGNKKFFIPTYQNTFNLKEVKQILVGLN